LQSRDGTGKNTSCALCVVTWIAQDPYTTSWCGFCVRAKTLLDSRGLSYEEVSLDDDPAFRQTVFEATGGWTVPQILVEDRPIGGYTELWRLDREGRLDELVAA
jgi:glutaredoxin 3